MDDCDLVASSDVVVEGEFIGTAFINRDADNETRLGIVRVKHTLKGHKSDVVLIQQPSSITPISSSDIFYKKGQQGVWVLNEFKGIYSADNPQQFKPLGDISVIESCLKK